MKLLCNYLGGSISYGLNTPTSDRDERFLFLNTEISKILGLERHEHESRQTNGEDVFGWELKHYLTLLRRGNTMCLEMLYNDTWLEITDEFKYIQSFKHQLINSDQLFKCLMGYCQSERRLVLGEKTGVLGGKRRGHLDTYGYSYKNAVQFLRLTLCGKIFFQEGYFPVNILQVDSNYLLFNIKTHPELYSKDDVIKLMDEYEKMLTESYNNIKVKYEYNSKLANDLCYELYMPILNEYKTK